ncbi:MAG: DUF6314 family protein [Rhodospirillales bacterium]
MSDLFSYLEGDWRIERRIDDRKLGETGTLAGVASFTPDADGLDYSETGTLHIGSYSGIAERRLRFRRGGPPETADIRFPDGRHFYRLDLGRGEWQARHDCPPDIYRLATLVTDASCWRQEWIVSGPRKDQTITTIFHRK